MKLELMDGYYWCLNKKNPDIYCNHVTIEFNSHYGFYPKNILLKQQ